MKKVRYVHAEKDEHIVVTRDRQNSSSGCLGIVLIIGFFSLLSDLPDALFAFGITAITAGALALGIWRIQIDKKLRGPLRLFSALAGGLVVALIVTLLLHDQYVDWATHTTHGSRGIFWWKEPTISHRFDPIESNMYHIIGFIISWASSYAVISFVYHFIEDEIRLTRRRS